MLFPIIFYPFLLFRIHLCNVNNVSYRFISAIDDLTCVFTDYRKLNIVLIIVYFNQSNLMIEISIKQLQTPAVKVIDYNELLHGIFRHIYFTE